MSDTLRKNVKTSSFEIKVTGIFGRNRKVKTISQTMANGAPDMLFVESEAQAAINAFLMQIKAKPGCTYYVERMQHELSDYAYLDKPGFYTMQSTLIRIGGPREILLRGKI